MAKKARTREGQAATIAYKIRIELEELYGLVKAGLGDANINTRIGSLECRLKKKKRFLGDD